MNVFAVLMAGGVGTRFWPRSRSKTPKQVLQIVDSQSMIQATYQRLRGLVKPGQVLIVTNVEHHNIIKEQLPEVQDESFILEPMGKNTAPCIGLAAVHVLNADPTGIMAVLPADHLITNVEEFQRVIRLAAQFVAEHDGLVTLGIEPTGPATGYGYIQRGDKVSEIDGHFVYRVKTFAEKPNYETAVRFLKSGDFYWNSGMFIWKASTILKEIEENLPEIYEGLMEIKASLGKPNYAERVQDVYRRIRGISIDFGVMQSATDVYVIPTDMGWSDVGSWEAVYQIAKKDKNKNAGGCKELVSLDSSENYVYSPEKLVALVGVKNLVIVDTGDALLICRKNRSEEVKDLVELLKKKGLEEYL